MNKSYKELNQVQRIGLLAQAIITLSILIVLFWTIGVPELMACVKELLVLLFLVMAFNNHILYKRKGFTIFNLAAAILLFISLLIK